MKLTTLPQLTQEELHILLAGLDELPGKLSRVLHRKITDHVESVIREFKEAESKAQEEIRRAKESSVKEAKDSFDREKLIREKFDEMRMNQAQGAAQMAGTPWQDAANKR